MIRHRIHGEEIQPAAWRELESALGLPISSIGRPIADVWDAIAHACNIADSTELLANHAGTIPAYIWNQAVDTANERTK